METIWQDVRYGIRMLLKAPSFSIVATIALALGIGANTAIFSVVNGVLLRPLPFTRSEQLMSVWETDPTRGQVRGSASYPNFADWREQNHVFERVASYHGNDFIMTGRVESTRLQGAVCQRGFVSFAADASDLKLGFRGHYKRSVDLRLRRPPVGPCSVACVLHPGATCGASRSDGGA